MSCAGLDQRRCGIRFQAWRDWSLVLECLRYYFLPPRYREDHEEYSPCGWRKGDTCTTRVGTGFQRSCHHSSQRSRCLLSTSHEYLETQNLSLSSVLRTMRRQEKGPSVKYVRGTIHLRLSLQDLDIMRTKIQSTRAMYSSRLSTP